MAKIVFIPSDHGGGLGHVSRCLYLSRLCKQSGHHAAIILEKHHYKKYQNLNYVKVFQLFTQNETFLRLKCRPPFILKTRLINTPPRPPIFLDFASLAWQVPRDEYYSAEIVNSRCRQISKCIDQFKPDFIVGDTHFLSRIMAIKYNIPLIQITRKAGYPARPEFLWWRKEKPRWKAPDALAPFKALLEQYKINDILKVEDLLKGDIYLVPAVPEIEPIAPDAENVVYSGPLIDTDPTPDQVVNKRSVYLTIGGGSRRSGVYELLKLIINAFKNTDIQVLISGGGLVPMKHFDNQYPNIRLADWVDGQKEISNHALILFHGGYGTMIEVLSAGKRTLVIPSHTEQEGNGRRLETLGISKVLQLFDKIDGRLAFDWPFGAYEMGAAFGFDLKSETLLAETNNMLNADVADKLAAISAKLKQAKASFTVNQIFRMI